MAKTALNQLQDQIDAVRHEAFAAGYAAAMQAVRELASKTAPSSDGSSAAQQQGQIKGRRGRPPAAAKMAATADEPVAKRQPRGAVKAATARAPRTGSRPSRGNNARLIEDILQAAGSRALRPAEIRSALQKEKGVAMAFTSIRHALGQLEGRHAAEQVGDSKTWRHLTGSTE